VRRANVISGVVLVLFGLVTVFAIIPWQIDPAPEGFVSPRLLPTLMMGVVIALSALLAFNNRRAGVADDPDAERNPISRSEIMALVKIGAVFTIALGFYLAVSPPAAGAALIVGALLALGERRPLVLVLMPTAFLLVLWAVFYKILGTAIL